MTAVHTVVGSGTTALACALFAARHGRVELAARLPRRRTRSVESVPAATLTLLLELGITSLAELADTLRGLDEGSITARMGYRYPPGAVRRLDDALLFRFGDRYVGLRGNADRMAALQSRWKKISTA